mgnify:CR=1
MIKNGGDSQREVFRELTAKKNLIITCTVTQTIYIFTSFFKQADIVFALHKHFVSKCILTLPDKEY